MKQRRQRKAGAALNLTVADKNFRGYRHSDRWNQFWGSVQIFLLSRTVFNFCHHPYGSERARAGALSLSKDFLRIQMQVVDGGADFTNIDRPGARDRSGIRIGVELSWPLFAFTSTKIHRALEDSSDI